MLTACRIASASAYLTSNSCTRLSLPIGIHIKLYPTLINHPSLPSATPQIPFLSPLLSLLSSSSLARPQTGCCSGGVDQEQVTKKFWEHVRQYQRDILELRVEVGARWERWEGETRKLIGESASIWITMCSSGQLPSGHTPGWEPEQLLTLPSLFYIIPFPLCGFCQAAFAVPVLLSVILFGQFSFHFFSPLQTVNTVHKLDSQKAMNG